MGRAETIEAILSFCKVRLVLSDMIIVVTLTAGGFWKFELCWILWWTVAKLLVRSSSFLEKKLTCARDRHTLHYKVVWISQKSKCTSRVTLPQTLDFVGFFGFFLTSQVLSTNNATITLDFVYAMWRHFRWGCPSTSILPRNLYPLVRVCLLPKIIDQYPSHSSYSLIPS